MPPVGIQSYIYNVLIFQAELEVERLLKLTGSRVKEIALTRQGELEEIFAQMIRL